MIVAARQLLLVELDQNAGIDRLLRQPFLLRLAPVAPDDLVGLAKLHHLLDPGAHAGVFGVGNGGLGSRYSRHGEFNLGIRSFDAKVALSPFWRCDCIARPACLSCCFMDKVLQILGSVIPLFAIMAVGAAVRRFRILNEEADRTILDLCVHLLLPALILDHLIANHALRDWKNLLCSPLLGFVVTSGCIFIAGAAARLWRFRDDAERRTFRFVAGIYNYGYIPVPLIAALYPASALGVLFLFNLGTEVAFWTVGFGGFMGHSLLHDWRRALTSPVKAIILGVSINLITACFALLLDDATLTRAAWGWPVKVAIDTIHLIGLCSIPLALLIIGATMADFWGEFHPANGAGVMGLAILVRNAICPLGFVLLAPCTLPVSAELKEDAGRPGRHACGRLHADSHAAQRRQRSRWRSRLFSARPPPR